jgi:hypothetical protein
MGKEYEIKESRKGKKRYRRVLIEFSPGIF